MIVVVADKFPDQYVHELKTLGLTVVYEPKLGATDLVRAAEDASILIVRSTVVNEACIQNSKRLSLIIRAGAGVNNIDIQAASARGIYVANCPGKNSIAVAELAMGLMLALDRRIPDNVIDFRSGTWNKALYSKADGVFGKTLGVIGTGKIGIEVITRARSFGMEVCAWSRSLTSERADSLGIRYCASIEEVVEQSDVLSVHLALKPETKGIISKSLIGRMKPGTLFINTSRAEVVDEDALVEALRGGKIRAGLDVFRNEPEGKEGPFTSLLQEVPNLYVTHHIGASTEQAQNAVAEDAVSIVRQYVQQGSVRNWVNRCQTTEAAWQLVVRHFDKPGVLANVMNVLKEGNINAEELENVIFDGKIAACCTIQLNAKPTDRMLEKIQSRTDEVISATLINVQKPAT
jgi:D-3-phosphoglycerate dehydrogenase / 2-oxoglutarate reductase